MMIKDKKEAIKIAVWMLKNIYKDDVNALASILNAEYLYREHGDASCIVQCLDDTRKFIDKLITTIEKI